MFKNKYLKRKGKFFSPEVMFQAAKNYANTESSYDEALANFFVSFKRKQSLNSARIPAFPNKIYSIADNTTESVLKVAYLDTDVDGSTVFEHYPPVHDIPEKNRIDGYIPKGIIHLLEEGMKYFGIKSLRGKNNVTSNDLEFEYSYEVRSLISSIIQRHSLVGSQQIEFDEIYGNEGHVKPKEWFYEEIINNFLTRPSEGPHS